MTTAKTNAERQAAFRLRKANEQAAEVRGIFAHPDDHAEMKKAAAQIGRRRQSLECENFYQEDKMNTKKPIAYAILLPNGSARMFSQSLETAKARATELGTDFVPLYAGATSAELDGPQIAIARVQAARRTQG